LERPSGWQNVVKGRCKGVPQAIIDYFWTLKLYSGGDDLLYGLSAARNDNEHWALTRTKINIFGIQIIWPNGRQEMFALPGMIVGSVNEIELFTTENFTTDYHITCARSVGFDGVFQEASPEFVFDTLCQRVGEIIDGAESVLRTNGYVL
jgi:hypothetical protein